MISPNSTWLVTSRLNTTRHVRRVERVETSVSSRAVPTWRTANKLIARFYALTYTNRIGSVKEINEINVYFNKLANNLHIITLYKLHNKLSCVSRLSRSSCRVYRASRARRVERVERVVSSVSNRALRQARLVERVVSRRDETSGICAIGRKILLALDPLMDKACMSFALAYG